MQSLLHTWAVNLVGLEYKGGEQNGDERRDEQDSYGGKHAAYAVRMWFWRCAGAAGD